MAECHRCPYMHSVRRKYGVTNHCNLACDHFDVTYYCEEPNKSKENIFCPFANVSTRFLGVDYHKYETDILTVKEKKNE
jgi:hypothetical protein